MDIARLLQQIGGRVLRGLMRKGIEKGVDYAARRGKPTEQMTDADHEQARSGKAVVRRLRDAQALIRRLRR